MVIIGCLFWLFLWVVLMWIIGNVTSWWMVLAINIGALLYIYLDDRKNSYYDEYRDYKKKRNEVREKLDSIDWRKERSKYNAEDTKIHENMYIVFPFSGFRATITTETSFGGYNYGR